MKTIFSLNVLSALLWPLLSVGLPPPPARADVHVIASKTGSSCDATTAITLSNAGVNSISLTVELPASSLAVELQYRARGIDAWTSVYVQRNPFLLENLLPCTDYELRARVLCQAFETGEFGSVVRFTTATGAGCPNRVPIGNIDYFRAPVHGAFTFNVLHNDRDLDGDALSLNSQNPLEFKSALVEESSANEVPQSAAGSVTYAENGEVTFFPSEGFYGTVHFEYQPFDGVQFGNLTDVYVYIPKPIPQSGSPTLGDICDYLQWRNFNDRPDPVSMECPVNSSSNPDHPLVRGWHAYLNTPDATPARMRNNQLWFANPAFHVSASEVQQHGFFAHSQPNRALGLYFKRDHTSGFPYGEIAYTRLKEALIPGQTYRLTFHATAVPYPGNPTTGDPPSPFNSNTTRLFVGLTGNPVPCPQQSMPFFANQVFEFGTESFRIPQWSQTNTPFTIAGPPSRSYPRSNGWVRYQVTFVATAANLEYLAIGVDQNSSENEWYAFVDDISIEGCICAGDGVNGIDLTFHRNPHNDEVSLTQIVPILQQAGLATVQSGILTVNLGGNTMAVNGHFILDWTSGPLTIQNGSILMAREASVVADRISGIVTFSNCRISCCEGYMWQGIRHFVSTNPSPHSSRINLINGSIVECAILGLDSENAQNKTNYNVLIANSTFRNNHIHARFSDISTNDYSDLPARNPSIYGSTFTCTGLLERPYNNTITHTGLVVQRSSIFLGGYGISVNRVQNCREVGIDISESPSVRMVNWRIERVNASNWTNTFPFPIGVRYLFRRADGIGRLFVEGTDHENHSLTNPVTNNRNEFRNLGKGIWFEPIRPGVARMTSSYAIYEQITEEGILARANSAGIIQNLHIARNYFRNCTTAISARNVIETLTIERNIIRDGLRGIDLWTNGNRARTSVGLVRQNRIHNVHLGILSSQNFWTGGMNPVDLRIVNHDRHAFDLLIDAATTPNAVAIEASYPPFPLFGTIGLTDVRWGIVVTSRDGDAQRVLIGNNHINQIVRRPTAQGDPTWEEHCGILVRECPHTVVRDNYVINLQPLPNVWPNSELNPNFMPFERHMFGIRLERSQHSLICNNITTLMSYGIAARGNSLPSTIASNDMTNCAYGYFHMPVADLGDQWRLNLQGQTVVYDNKWQSSFWSGTPRNTVENGAHIYRINDNQRTEFRVRQGAPFNPHRMGMNVVGQHGIGAPVRITELNASTIGVSDDCEDRPIQNMPRQPGSGSGLFSYNRHEIQQLAKAAATTTPPADTFAAVSRYELLSFLYHELVVDPSLRDSSAVLDSFYLAQAGSNRPRFEQIERVLSDTTLGLTETEAIDSAAVLNEGINPLNGVENNMKVLNRLRLYTMRNPGVGLDPAKYDSLYWLARQCRWKGGWPVHEARLHLLRLRPDSLGDYDTCLTIPPFDTVPQPRMAANPSTKVGAELNQVTVYPNPTTGLLSIECESTPEQPLTVSLWDLMGRLIVAERRLTERQNEMDLGSLPQGLYLLRVRSSSEDERIIKIVKQ